MFISKEEMNRRLSDPNNLTPLDSADLVSPNPVEKIEHKRSGPGRTKGTKNRTDEERQEIAELAVIFGPSEAARLTGCSNSQTHSYAHGFNTCAQRLPNGNLGKSAAASLEEVKNRTIDKILKILDLIDEDKLNNQTPIAQSQIAVNLSKVPSNLENRRTTEDINQSNQVNVVIYSPPVRDEDKYKVVSVS